jgi:hypothetical protein
MSDDSENHLPQYLTPEILASLPTTRKTLDDEVIEFPSYSAGFIQKWGKLDDVLATEELAAKASSFVFWEQFRAADWQHYSFLCFSKGYRYYGLESLSDLFGQVVRSRLRARPRYTFDKSYFVIPDDTLEDRKVCTFEEWEKAHWLTAFEFGLVKDGDPESDRDVKALLHRHGLKLDDAFLQDLATLKSRPDRWRNREFLKRLAMAWDIFVIPLRFFTDEAAKDFALENLVLQGKDLSNYRKLVHRGGAKRQNGFRLVSAKPPIISTWQKVIVFNKAGAEHHGFPIEPALKLLREFAKKKVHLV